ncbi:two-component system capsular synthesis response regulator RcsB [Flavobacterium sp. W4I14]|nr:two-component system capsular synthesis response regulator RcsB [Flavobacterium sp. W4I14]
MFKKVLIAEDQQMASISIVKTMESLGISQRQYTYYCDDALMHIRKALQSGDPFDLLITDLSFAEDHREQKLKGGEDLITAAKALQGDIRIVVFSAEGRPAVIRSLYQELGINAFVQKGRRDAEELSSAVETIVKGRTYMPLEIKKTNHHHNTFEFDKLDITIVSQLSKGTKQKNIPSFLDANGISPSGLSTVEKRLKEMREGLGFSNNEQLIVYCRDYGII